MPKQCEAYEVNATKDPHNVHVSWIKDLCNCKKKKQHYLPSNRKLKLRGGGGYGNLMGNTHL